MISRRLEDLFPPFRRIVEAALKIADNRSLPVTVICTARSEDVQLALWAQGREALASVNSKRAACGLPAITAEENRKKVTWTKKTYHNTKPYSMAFDFAIGRGSGLTWDVKADVNADGVPDYREFAEICKELDHENIECGADWERADWGHIQWKNGLQIDQDTELKKMATPVVEKTTPTEVVTEVSPVREPIKVQLVDPGTAPIPTEQRRSFFSFLISLFSKTK